jgi:hypothetical protein
MQTHVIKRNCSVAGVALFYSPLALSWDLLLSSMLIEERRGMLFEDHGIFDGLFPSISHCGDVFLLIFN